MTRLGLQNLLLYWVDDLGAGYFTPTQVNVWLNNAQKEVQRQLIQANSTYYNGTAVQTPTVVNQFDYVLPSDFLVLHRLELVVSGTGINEVVKRLQPVTLNQKELVNQGSGVPECYTLKKDRVSLWPAPDSTAYYLRLYYSPVVADMVNDSDVPDVPPQYHDYVAVIAALDAFIKDDRMPQNLLAKREAYEKLLKQMADERLMDESRGINITSDDGYGSPF